MICKYVLPLLAVTGMLFAMHMVGTASKPAPSSGTGGGTGPSPVSLVYRWGWYH